MRLMTAFSILLLAACGRDSPAVVECCTATITVVAPERAPTVYLTGNLPELGPWKADALAMTGEGRERVARVRAARGTVLEYKVTLGDWAREAVGPSGMVMANFRLDIDADLSARHEIADFKKDPQTYIDDWQGAGVKGRLVYWQNVASAHLGPVRHVSIWLPPGYDQDTERRYKVLYMSDGQNLFDPRIANTGVDWGVDEAVTSLVEEGVIDPVIVVGVWSTSMRGPEYSPWAQGPAYARFLIEELAPRIDAEFRTLTGPANTAHMGSSMGGLLSFFLVTEYPAAFGACGCVSTHFPLSEAMSATYFPMGEAADNPDPTPYILKDIAAGLTVPKSARMWFDYGTLGLDAGYGPTHEAVRAMLVAQGFVEGEDFVMRPYAGADHNETAWRTRLKDPLRFLYAKAP